MDFTTYIPLACVTAREDLKFWDNGDEQARRQLAAMAALGLAGELVEHEIDPSVDEAGDFMWYAGLLARVFDIDTTKGDLIARYSAPTNATGKICEMVKKWVFHNKDIRKTEIEEWLVECISYINTRYDLSEVLEFNVAKLKKRYPDGFSIT